MEKVHIWPSLCFCNGSHLDQVFASVAAHTLTKSYFCSGSHLDQVFASAVVHI